MATAALSGDHVVRYRLLGSPRVWLTVVAVFTALFAGYWFFVRTDWVPLLRDLSGQDAAAVVKVLEDRKVAYRLSDGGRTVLVASGEADAARVELASSELPMRGQVGFELFNQSDMGLTEFAQKINYQRALQGELARTILLLDGIAAVRVHLGLPEQSVFRDLQVRPKASVALILKPGAALTEAAVGGIQRMVAGAVPDLGVEGVSVLDGSGRVISSERLAPPFPLAGSDAVLESYRREIAMTIARRHPELPYDLNLSLRPVVSAVKGLSPEGPQGPGADLPSPRGNPDFAVNVRITTQGQLDDGVRQDLIRVIEDIVGFERERGDAIVFLVGEPLPAQPSATAPVGERVVTKAAAPPGRREAELFRPWWVIASLVLAGLFAATWYRDRRRSSRRRQDELISFAQQMRSRLAAAEGMAA